ncbi:single-stranded-DNA-specific exonuclease RecJ [Paenibacillus guangzhouensis]|uniref:single-stranded-DNA-specific exonuclease RecJ n=1 Tax=Paenibacillus guangzhouensis TaxID=1473112 RepID=UPI001266C767|nr:single-stranded-DNA-specific exonuclease RecJ [Paenibacillus guangzhouensis]
MLHSKMKWLLKENPQPEQVQRLAEETGVSSFIAQLLIVRGIDTVEQVEMFLRGSLTDLHDPFLLKGMTAAVERIERALEQGEKIRIYGDYDADGVSSTSLMIELFRALGANFDTYIPHRMTEGYGMNIPAMDHAAEHGVQLIVTVDTGISAVDQIAYANQLGIDVVVTDHHEPPEILPNAVALVNPKIHDCPYPFKGLAGVGVAFKLAHALLGRVPEELLEFVTLGTIADLMPLNGENRILVRYGLERMRRSTNLGVRALFETADMKLPQIGSTQVAFAMAPRINASGRLEHAMQAVELLTTRDPGQAKQLAVHLDALNRARQDLVEEITVEAVQQLELKMASSQDGALPKVIVLAGEGWNVGVIGIVASKILERYYRPTLILGIDAETGMCKGSARSIEGFNLYEALTECSELLDHYGGHEAAAGLTMERDHLAAFEARMISLAERCITAEHEMASIEIDLECKLSEATVAFIESLEELAPFGMANPAPRVKMRGLRLKESRQIGQEKQHLKLTLAEGRLELDAISFRNGPLAGLMNDEAVLDLVGELQINEWNGRRKAQLLVQDLAVPHVQCYDGRGTRNPQQYIEKTHVAWEQAGRFSIYGPKQHGIVASDAYWRQWDEPPFDTDTFTCLVYDQEVGLRPISSISKQQHFEVADLQSLYLIELPEEVTVVDAILQYAARLERIYVLYDNLPAEDCLRVPSREEFKRVYVDMMRERSWSASESGNAFIRGMKQRTGLSDRTLQHVMEVFTELGFIQEVSGRVVIVEQPQKADLTTAQAYRDLERKSAVEEQLLAVSASQLARRFGRQYL